MSLLAVPIIALFGLVISLCIAFGYFFWIKKISMQSAVLREQYQMSELLVNEMKYSLDSQKMEIEKLSHGLAEQTLESKQVTNQLEHRIKVLQQNFSNIEEKFQQCLEHQPEDKLYSRAYKLAALGADIEEIITECELPRAEAEMLLSVYARSEK